MSTRRLPTSQYDVNLWRIPLQMSLGAIALFALCMVVDVMDKYGIIHLPFWLTMGGIDDARAILSAMLSAVSTVLALIFSVTLVVLSMVATLFGPRLLYRFIQDKVTQITIGLFMGSFIFIFLVFLVTHQDSNSTFIPQAALIVSWIVVLTSFAFLVYYSHRLASSIQNPDMVARIVDDFAASLKEANRHLEVTSVALPAGAGEVLCLHSGYLQEVGHTPLMEVATESDATVHILFRPGQFVLQGEPIARIEPAERTATLEPHVKREVRLGRHRILKQDSEFGIYQIVEIAIRALSPAVNDTFTGVACVDWLGDALIILAAAPPTDGRWNDASGRVRLTEPPLRFDRLAKAAFDQIRQAAADNPAVLIRMLGTIRRLVPRVSSPQRASLLEHAAAIRETAGTRTMTTMDRNDIEAAWRSVQNVADGVAPTGQTS